MIKLRFSPPVYKTYNGGRITTCTYKCQKVDSAKKEVLAEFSVMGKSWCSEQDTPDEKIGRIIAESRAKYLAYKRVTIPQGIIKDLEEALDELAEIFWFNERMNRCKKRELEHLKYIAK